MLLQIPMRRGFQECIVDVNKHDLYYSRKWKVYKPAFEWTLKYTSQSTTGSGTRCVMILMELGENTKWNLIYCSLTYLCFWLYRGLIVFLNPMTKKKKIEGQEGLSLNSQEMFVELHRDQFNTLKLNTILFRQIIFEEYFQTWIG